MEFGDPGFKLASGGAAVVRYIQVASDPAAALGRVRSYYSRVLRLLRAVEIPVGHPLRIWARIDDCSSSNVHRGERAGQTTPGLRNNSPPPAENGQPAVSADCANDKATFSHKETPISLSTVSGC